MLQCVCSVLQCVAVCLQCVAVCCSALQYVAVCLQFVYRALQGCTWVERVVVERVLSIPLVVLALKLRQSVCERKSERKRNREREFVCVSVRKSLRV